MISFIMVTEPDRAGSCPTCSSLPDSLRCRQKHDGSWPGRPGFIALAGAEHFEKCPECGLCWFIRLDPGGMVSTSDAFYERVDSVQSELIRRMADRALDEETAEALLGTARNHDFIREFVRRAAGLDYSTLIPALVRALGRPKDRQWSMSILSGAVGNGCDIRPAFPILAKLLSDSEPGPVHDAAEVFVSAALHRVDISCVVAQLTALKGSSDASTAFTASEALRYHSGQRKTG